MDCGFIGVNESYILDESYIVQETVQYWGMQ